MTSALSGLKNAIGFDFLYSPEDGATTVFWSDITHDKIFRGTLSNSREFGLDWMGVGLDLMGMEGRKG